MNEKRRPDNGPGANGLRGGSRTYSVKVQTPNWVEMYGGPAYYKRGFTNVDFQTECQHQQKGATLTGPPQFGAGLPLPAMHLKSDPSTADSFVETEYVDRRSTMQYSNDTMMANKADFKEYKPIPTLSREALETYRQNWTADTEVGRNVRFITESRLAGACIKKFGVRTVRLLPGSPKALENFRERLIERFGIFGLSAMRDIVGSGDIAFSKLREGIQLSGVQINKYEFDQITAFITASSSSINGRDFLRNLKGNPPGFDAAPMRTLFKGVDASGNDSGLCSIADLLDGLESRSLYPEVLEGMHRFIVAYSSDSETLSMEEFIEFHSDMYASAADNYKQILK